MDSLKRPKRLEFVSDCVILNLIDFELKNKKAKLNPNDSKSVFGVALRKVLNQDSTNDERHYINNLWKATNKENEASEHATIDKKVPKKYRRKALRRLFSPSKPKYNTPGLEPGTKRPHSSKQVKKTNFPVNEIREHAQPELLNTAKRLKSNNTAVTIENKAKKKQAKESMLQAEARYELAKAAKRVKSKTAKVTDEDEANVQNAKELLLQSKAQYAIEKARIRINNRARKPKQNVLRRMCNTLFGGNDSNQANNDIQPTAPPLADVCSETESLLSISPREDNEQSQINHANNVNDNSDNEELDEYQNNEPAPVLDAAYYRLQKMIKKYERDIHVFPTFLCPICKRYLYNNNAGVRRYTFTAKMIDTLEKNSFYDFRAGQTVQMCRRCAEIMTKYKIPPMYHRNNMETPHPPEVLAKLNEVETRLISQVKLFMKIFHLCKGRGQAAIKGSCVHFPQSVDEIIEKLPLNQNAADMLIVNEANEEGKIIDDYKVHAKQLYEALQFLKANNPLYRNVDIQIMDESDLQLNTVNKETVTDLNCQYDAVRDHVLSQPSTGFKQIDGLRAILRGNIHQASADAFPSGGNQCTANCMSAFAHAFLNPINTWTSHELDNVLFSGDNYYAQHVPERNRYLSAYEASGTLQCFGAIRVNCNAVEDVYQGFMNKLPGNHHQRLQNSLLEFIDSDYNYGILTTNGFSMGVAKYEDHVYFFDSHSRGPRGRIAAMGTAVIIKYSAASEDERENCATEISKLVHRNCQTSENFIPGLPDVRYIPFCYTLTPILCTTVEPANENGIDEPAQGENHKSGEDDSNENDEIENCGDSMPINSGLVNSENYPRENREDFRDTMQSNDGHKNNTPSNQPIQAPSNHIMLDCVIRADEPIEPTIGAFVDACKSNKEVIPAVQICRERGMPMYPEREQKLEELAFVKAFPTGRNGFNEERKIAITPLDYFQQRVLGDNKAFHSNEYLFYALNRVESYTLNQKIAVCGNMVRNNGQANRDDEINVPGLENVHLYMQGLRGSGSYWKKYTGDVLAMIESLGIPTFFLTISYDDLNSFDALTALWKAKYGPSASLPCEPKDLSYEERKDLLNNRPVAAARHFSQKMNVILSLIKHEGEFLFGRKVVDYTYRVEFQGRGSPHVHALIWVENPPDYNTPEGQNFIENNISCSLDVHFKDLVLRYQNHRHSSTCFKKHNVCRFGFPRKQCTETRILDDEETAKNHGRFLELKRSQNEIMINNYHPKLLQILKCNMDIQLVTGCRAIAYYIGKYMSKAEPLHLREEIRNIVTSFKADSRSAYFEKAKKIANAIIRQREISSQECAFRLCHLLLRKSSRGFVFVPTYKPENRLRLVRRDTIFSRDPKIGMNVIDRYEKRPHSLAHLSLIEFAAWWKPRPNKFNTIDEEIIENDEENDEEEICATLNLLDGKGAIQKRKNFAVVRYPRFKLVDQTDDHLYSMMLLYKPFRCEAELMDGFNSIEDAFNDNKFQFRRHQDDPIINPELAEQIEAVMLQLMNRQDETSQSANSDEEDDVRLEFINEMRQKVFDENEIFGRAQASDLQLNERIQSLNPGQKKILDMVHERLGRSNERNQMLQFIQGQAGVGKSFTIQCICDLVTKLHHAKERAILMAAPTGVAARNIGASTIHKTFSLVVDKFGGSEYVKLGSKLLHDRRRVFKNVSYIIIDEISMVSYEKLRSMHLRLTEIFANDEPFGGVNVLIFGDLLQIEPVWESWCFNQPRKFSHETNLWSLFGFHELHTVMRQRERDEFYEILQRLRIGTMMREDIAVLRQRQMRPSNPNYLEMLQESRSSLHLYPKVYQVDAYNSVRLREFRKNGIRVYKLFSQDRYVGDNTYKQVDDKHLYSDPRKCAGMPKILELSVDTKVMLKWNIDPYGGLCNGSIGIVRGFRWTGLRRNQLNEGDLPESVYAEFEGKIASKHLSRRDDFAACVEVKQRTFEFKGKANKWIARTQIPLVASFACTIHKAQGISLDKCTVYLGTHLFKQGLAYTACTRVRTFDGLYITDISAKKLLVDKRGRGPCNDVPLQELYRLKLRKFLKVDKYGMSVELFNDLLCWVLEYVMCRKCKFWVCLCTCKK